MRRNVRIVSSVITALTLVGAIGCSVSANAGGKKVNTLEEGKKLAFAKKKGNCLACHLIAGGKQAGTIAPPLIAMKARFPKKADLRAQIYDARAKNPGTIMPPFGPHGILSPKELDMVVEFIQSL